MRVIESVVVNIGPPTCPKGLLGYQETYLDRAVTDEKGLVKAETE